ncbi:MAG: MBL fold metallo-hydrolase [Chloroflexi bacterium]|nr:MBL fold metallo-hydrolase [Chloroflexota bacterium]
MELYRDPEIRIECLPLGGHESNCYLLFCLRTREVVIIDAPDEGEKIAEGVRGAAVRALVITHSHGDHVGAVEELRSRLKMPVVAHIKEAEDVPSGVDFALVGGETIRCGQLTLEVMATPGHTPGSISLRLGRHLFGGDTLFPNGPGYTRTPASFRRLIATLRRRIFTLPDDTIVYPGHGATTTLGQERKLFNRFLSRPLDANICGDVLWM